MESDEIEVADKAEKVRLAYKVMNANQNEHSDFLPETVMDLINKEIKKSRRGLSELTLEETWVIAS